MQRYIILFLFLFFSHPLYAHQTLAKHGMVVSEQYLASQIGANILRQGGNAIDAAVAVGYALAVVNPCCGNIGGGGFMLIHLANGKNIFINFREKAPLYASKNMFVGSDGKLLENKSTQGYLAVAVPGTVLGLDTALKKYGSMTRQQVMAPAIALAENGFTVTSYDAKIFKNYALRLQHDQNVAAIFLKKCKSGNGLCAYAAGDILKQKDLARTLKLISEKGPEVFYHGEIAKEIVQASQANGGILTLEDFAKFTVEIMQPIQCNYRGYTIISAPPPSSGGVTLCETLNILENFPLRQLGHLTPKATQYIIEAMRYGFIDRNLELGDPDFVTNPIEKLLSKKYAATLSKKILATEKKPTVNSTKVKRELTDTTHYSIVDAKGNAVAVTYTLNGFFGALVIADHTGFFLNDEMDDFTSQSGTPNKFGLVMDETNDIEPGKRPLSSMAPTIVLKDNHLYLVLGSPGGPRIITTVLLTLINVLDYQMGLQQAIDAPRYHYQVWPDTVDMETNALPAATINNLEGKGYQFQSENPWSAVEAILIESSGILQGANDKRRTAGKAVEY